jgi:hypothetical protein
MQSIDCKCGDKINLPPSLSGIFDPNINTFKSYWICIRCSKIIKLYFTMKGDIIINIE